MRQQQQKPQENLRDIGAPTLAQSSAWSYIATKADTSTLAQERERDDYAGRFARYREKGMTPKQIAMLLKRSHNG